MQPDQLSWLESALVASAQELIAGRLGESEQPWQETLTRLTAAAAASVPGASYAGLTMRDPGGSLISQAPSHSAIAELDRAQAELGEGPCVDALTPGGPAVVRVGDFAAESRWPRFAPAAVHAGVASLLSYALAPHGAAPGAINFYGTEAHAFADDTARAVASAFAMQAAVAVYGAHRIANLTRAVDSRDVIGQAKGILMERFGLEDADAFELLVKSSQDTNIKLVEVARWLVTDTTRRATSSTEQPPPEAATRRAAPG